MSKCDNSCLFVWSTVVNLFVEKQVMLPATLPDIESEFYVVKIYFLP